MADQPQEERTEQPTPKRLKEAREKGEVPRSRELTMTGVMLTGAAGLLMLAGPMGGRIVENFRRGFDIERGRIFDTDYMAMSLGEQFVGAFRGLIPFIVLLVFAVFLSSAALGGLNFSAKALAFKPERLNPISGLKRIFGANALNELIKSIGKFTFVALLAMLWLWYCFDELIGLSRESVRMAIAHALTICGWSLLVVSCGLIGIAAIDAPFQKWQFTKKMRMTRKEVKDEMKETEGRPEVKSKIRQLQQQVAQRRMMEAVPEADVVITNPTHFAVALAYDDGRMGAPRVVAKGADLVAARIREIAEEHRVPLFSAPPLARALYASTEIDEEIPAKLYTAVAQVLAYVYQLKTTLKPGQKRMPPPVPDVDESEFPDPRKGR